MTLTSERTCRRCLPPQSQSRSMARVAMRNPAAVAETMALLRRLRMMNYMMLVSGEVDSTVLNAGAIGVSCSCILSPGYFSVWSSLERVGGQSKFDS